MKRVGIFSGTFDPVHNGHIEFAKQALGECQLDKVYFLVEPSPRRKQGVRAMEHRIQMVQLAIRDNSKLGIVILDEQQFSVEKTLPALLNRFKGAELSILFGDDVLNHLTNWPDIDKLLKTVSFIVGARGNIKEVEEHIKQIKKTRGTSFNYSIFLSSLSRASSSSVRLSLRRGYRSRNLHPAVQQYIENHGLYAPKASS